MLKDEDVEQAVVEALALQAKELSEEAQINEPLERLISSPTKRVFDAAVDLCNRKESAEKRLLGVRLLGEIGRPIMPFAEQSVNILTKLIEAEEDTELLVWEISAIGNQGDKAALPILWENAAHSDPQIRYAVSGSISASLRNSILDARSRDVLLRLARDRNTEVRFSATFELTTWWESGFRDHQLRTFLLNSRQASDERISQIVEDLLGQE